MCLVFNDEWREIYYEKDWLAHFVKTHGDVLRTLITGTEAFKYWYLFY